MSCPFACSASAPQAASRRIVRAPAPRRPSARPPGRPSRCRSAPDTRPVRARAAGGILHHTGFAAAPARSRRRVAAPAMTPASTNGDRLFGRPMTSAGMPSTAASSATVEFTVTTARLRAQQRRERGGGRQHADVRRGLRRPARRRPAFRPGWVLIASCTSGIAAHRVGERRQARAAPRVYFVDEQHERRAIARAGGSRARDGSRPASGAAASRTSASSRGLPVTASDSGGNCPRCSRCCARVVVEEQRQRRARETRRRPDSPDRAASRPVRAGSSASGGR